jgi:valyl-tRNA synthetase
MELNKAYSPKEVEEEVYKHWEDSGYFNPDELPGKRKEPFVIVIPPPNITGSLHMGHALNNCIQDCLTRFERMRGKLALWVPGTDHAGIATQNIVEKELKKEGFSRHDLGREKFIEKVWEWRRQYGDIILDQLKKLGASADWSRTRFTMDEGYAKAVLEAFIHYYKKGWIYQGERLINWCPRCETALSDLEIEYEEEKTKLWYIRYPLKQQPRTGNQEPEYIVVATTRPETMLGDEAVAINPKDKRYKKFIGKKVILPLKNKEIPIIADKAVEQEFGTGVVKVTPAHDLTDFEIAQRHKLPITKIINEKGKMTAEAGELFAELTVTEARKKVVAELHKQEYLIKEEDYVHNIGICYRCESVIEPLVSNQWFVKMDDLAKKAVKAVRNGKVKFQPKRWEKIYFDWLENIRDWNISRQIWWGHRLPVWYCACEDKNKKYEASIEPPKIKCETCRADWKQVDDVLDTWFSSALWPFAVFEWPEKGNDLERFYPTQVLSTARDIINLWVARMIFSGLEFLGKEPFSEVIIHATILTKEGKRMSKSLGTGADPLEFVDKYGGDATRFGILYQYLGAQDLKFGEEPIQAGKKFANKIWNASRFVLMQLEKNKEYELEFPKEKLTKLDKEFIKEINELTKKMTRDLEKFRFGQALHVFYDFFWHRFADVYIEDAKKRVKPETQQMLITLLGLQLKLLHPFMPFITEAIYDKLPIKDKLLLMVEEWPKYF